ncbi:response regulator [Massilia niabensis]|uniref:Response regulator n=1 Tax=Massilia niabensis TaxID=544910 RepID=A0ABW0L5F8_9BURK
MDNTISVLIADDHPLILDGLAALIESEPGFVLAGRATDGVQALAMYAHLRPDVMLIDLHMPGGGGMEAISRIRALDTEARIVVLSGYEGEEDVFRALDSGASAYLLKRSGAEQVMQCIRRVVETGRFVPPELASKLARRIACDALSKRELEILTYISTGKSNKMVARAAGIGVGTVKYHVNNILSKLNVSCRTEAACVAMQRGLIHPY